jgi:hypothetical protein
MDMSMEEVIERYTSGLITDQECWDMLDAITNQSTTLVEKVDFDIEEEMEHDYDWDVDNAVEYDYELEASQYDYL